MQPAHPELRTPRECSFLQEKHTVSQILRMAASVAALAVANVIVRLESGSSACVFAKHCLLEALWYCEREPEADLCH